MQITVSVQLGPGDSLAYKPDAAAMQVLVALGGNATKDFCSLRVLAAEEPGTAGTRPPTVVDPLPVVTAA